MCAPSHLFMLCGMTARVFMAALLAAITAAQGGDQFLDGIGETGLVARYVLNANAEDASRNQFHATLRGNGGTFVDDEQFRRTLLLTGDGSHLQLPGETLTGEDTLSVTAWLFLPTGASGPVFDFGQNASTRLYAVANPGGGGGADGGGFRASIVMDGKVRGETAAAPIVANRWMHVAVVLDPASRVLTTYLDGATSGSGGGRDGERRADRAIRRTAPRTVSSSADRRTTPRRPSMRGCATCASIASR